MSKLLENLFQYKFMIYVSIVIPILMAITMLFVRRKVALQPITLKRILLPTIMMSTGLIMFVFPFFYITIKLLIEALVVGLFFAIILIKLSKFKVEHNQIYLLQSKYIMPLLLFFFVIRMFIKIVIGTTITVGQTGGTFFVLAFSMLATWRIAMAIRYLKLRKKYNPLNKE